MADPKTPSPLTDQAVTAPLPLRAHPAHKEPQQIGAFRILEKIGEGGMGIVYKAEQREPVRRLVALKVIKLGMDSKEVVARFEAERQALALMNHPNVARVLDAGLAESGRPYFAMEFVAGVPLTQYCDDHKLSTRQRLELFIPVCHAIQHAHQKGIIHRDLKPTNVLVTIFDGKPVPKVIDFGIAKATNQALTAHTIYTQTGALIGTPEYMSPEQAMTSGLDVDTRTDVYSLGVILYELLSGTLPFDAKALREAGIEGMARMIRETEPQKPSIRLTVMSPDPKRPTTLTHRGDTRTVQREVRGDLDWITLKAMEKDRTRRYESASALAADVQRHLDSEPVLARPPSATYRLTKFVRKHKASVAAASAVVAALVIALGAAILGFVRVRYERNLALDARKLADEQRIAAIVARDDANSATRFLQDLFMAMSNAADAKARMHAAIKRLDDGWLKDQPATQVGCRITMAFFLIGLGSLDEAQRQFEISLELCRLPDGAYRPEAASVIHNGLGSIAIEHRDWTLADKHLRQAVAYYRKLENTHANIADVLTMLANTRQQLGDPAGAQAANMEALAARIEGKTAELRDKPNDALAHRVRGTLLVRSGRFKEALSDYAQSIRLDPADHWTYYLAGSLSFYLNDEKAWQETTRQMLTRFADTSTREIGDRLSKALLLSPAVSQQDLQTCTRLMDQALARRISALLPWFQLTKALLEYRAGRYESALEWVNRARNINSHIGGASVELLAAMALHRSGNTDKGKDFLKRAQSRLADTAPKPTINDLAPVEDYLICQILLREAEALIQK